MPHPSGAPKPVPAAAPASGRQYTYIQKPSIADINNALQDIQDRIYAVDQAQRVTAAKPTAHPDQIPTPKQTATQLSNSGSDPLNVNGLPGVLAQVQPAAIPIVSALPAVGQSQQDQVVFFSGHLYHFSATPAPGAWTLIL